MSARDPLITRCRDCRRTVIVVAWDHQEDLPPISLVRLDPNILTSVETLASILTGRTIWQHRMTAAGPTFSKHTRWWPRTPQPGHILPAHDCARTYPNLERIRLDQLQPTIPDTCPF